MEKTIEKTEKLNLMAKPQIKKVVVNVGLGRISGEKKAVEQVVKDLTTITGQKGVMRAAKKSIAGFKLREGMIIGYQTTLRGKRMQDFISRLVNVAIPRIRDFKGLEPKGFDAQGNFNLGIREHIIFPEINYEDVDKPYGFNITISIKAKTSDEALDLLKSYGFPFHPVKSDETKKAQIDTDNKNKENSEEAADSSESEGLFDGVKEK